MEASVLLVKALGGGWRTEQLGRAASGSVIPFMDPSTGLYLDTVTRYFRIAPTDSKIIYRIIVASTVANLTTRFT